MCSQWRPPWRDNDPPSLVLSTFFKYSYNIDVHTQIMKDISPLHNTWLIKKHIIINRVMN